jgi:Ni,Fe-hydrogenase I cytochrome b subunit
MMSDDNKTSLKETLKTEIKSDKKFFIRIAVVSVLIVIGYYLFSPYQNCVRSQGEDSEGWCMTKTSW